MDNIKEYIEKCKRMALVEINNGDVITALQRFKLNLQAKEETSDHIAVIIIEKIIEKPHIVKKEVVANFIASL